MSTAITEQLLSSRKSLDALTKQLNAKDVSEAKESEEYSRMATMVVAAVSKIPVPKDGKDGRNGMDGFDGNDGVDGVNGNHGKNGIDGKTGPMGKTGKPGKDGKDGKDGISITGDSGIAGMNGKDGEDGKDGLDGTNGKDGIQGNDGKDGVAGKDGKDGLNGKDGAPGLRGNDGINGVDGIAGSDGRDGKTGKPGKDGVKGKDGYKGKVGPRGKQGDTGVGIDDVTIDGATLKFSLSNNKYKKVTLPLKQGGGAPIAPPPVQWARRTPVRETGIVSQNVGEALVELNEKIVQSSTGNPFPPGTSESFMFNFNPYDETHDGSFDYDVDGKLISKTIETSAEVVLYTVTFSYNGSQLSGKTISDEVNNDSVTVVFNYDEANRLINKTHTYNG